MRGEGDGEARESRSCLPEKRRREKGGERVKSTRRGKGGRSRREVGGRKEGVTPSDILQGTPSLLPRSLWALCRFLGREKEGGREEEGEGEGGSEGGGRQEEEKGQGRRIGVTPGDILQGTSFLRPLSGTREEEIGRREEGERRGRRRERREDERGRR